MKDHSLDSSSMQARTLRPTRFNIEEGNTKDTNTLTKVDDDDVVEGQEEDAVVVADLLRAAGVPAPTIEIKRNRKKKRKTRRNNKSSVEEIGEKKDSSLIRHWANK